MSNDNVKIQITGADVRLVNRTLDDIAEALKSSDMPLHLGAKKPSEMVKALQEFFAEKLANAPVIGAPPVKPEGQR